MQNHGIKIDSDQICEDTVISKITQINTTYLTDLSKSAITFGILLKKYFIGRP